VTDLGEMVAVAREMDSARTELKEQTERLKELGKAVVRSEARYKIERARVTNGLAKGEQYLIDKDTKREQLVGGKKMAAANIKGVAEGVIAGWDVRRGDDKVELDVCKAFISAAEKDLDALRSKNKHLTHT